MVQKKWIFTAVVIAVIAIGAIINNYYSKQSSALNNAQTEVKSSKGKKALNVNAIVVSHSNMNDNILTTGSLMPDEEVNLSFETSGKIVSINFSEGSYVKKGQLLAKVNDAPLLAQLSKYEAQIKLAENRLYRQSTLLEKDAVSQEAFEQAKTELATLQAEIALVKANIGLTELRAPFDGIIGLRNVSEGSYASPSIVVAKMTKISPLKIEFSIPERYASQIVKGTPLEFTVDGRLETFKATVYATESQINTGTRTLSVRAQYPNTGIVLLPGRYANIKIQLREIENTIAIPTESVIPELGVDKVFVYRNGTAQPAEIKTGLRTESHIQVLEGLTPGDTLIISGTLQLRTGLKVTLDNIN